MAFPTTFIPEILEKARYGFGIQMLAIQLPRCCKDQVYAESWVLSFDVNARIFSLISNPLYLK
jgi:hypothetical protein